MEGQFPPVMKCECECEIDDGLLSFRGLFWFRRASMCECSLTTEKRSSFPVSCIKTSRQATENRGLTDEKFLLDTNTHMMIHGDEWQAMMMRGVESLSPFPQVTPRNQKPWAHFFPITINLRGLRARKVPHMLLLALYAQGTRFWSS